MTRVSFQVGVLAVGILLCLPGMVGCNLYDGIDSALTARTDEDLLAEGNLALASADYAAAAERFDTLLGRGNAGDPVIRGKGETLAGQAGFAVLRSLDALQNGIGPYDRGPVCFRTAWLARDRQLLAQGLTWMSRLARPDRPDRISRALMKVGIATRLLIDKYDTNHNRRLDANDEIDFDTNDGKTPPWPILYRDLVTGPASDGETLEQVFADLAIGFDGRGDTWNLISPVIGQTFTGTYTDSNRATIRAVGDLVERLKAAHPYFEVNVASFAAAIRHLDGGDD